MTIVVEVTKVSLCFAVILHIKKNTHGTHFCNREK